MPPESLHDELAGLLNRAAGIAAALPAMNVFVPFDTPADFSASLKALCVRVRARDHTALRDLAVFFAPTGYWDDTVGRPGMEIANRITERLDALHWNQ